MSIDTNDYLLEIQAGGEWREYWSCMADTDEAAEQFALAHLEDDRPNEGDTFRLVKLLGEVEVTYRRPPDPPPPEMEQMSFG